MNDPQFLEWHRELHDCLSFEEIQDWMRTYKNDIYDWYVSEHPGVRFLEIECNPVPTEMIFEGFTGTEEDDVWRFNLWSKPYNHVFTALILPKFGIYFHLCMQNDGTDTELIGARFSMEKKHWPVMQVHELLSKD